ncbi:MAG: manganese efflux pump MntP family protein [Desulfuromonadales bacterium]|jgi:putative Mn2+ efflux pump MntP|nr:manganese efflux pump MntP family protein [Desulfuromonadales bacterium]MDH3868382.1 manganese efflux pump MntP family protein [Desulfuromonadales bacterium]
MDAITLTGLALALAMDAFAVALGTGAVLSRLTGRHLFRLGFHFGLFQALMPVIGWLAGLTIMQWVEAWDHWIAFSLLAIIGGRMIYEAFSDEEKTDDRDPTKGLSLVLLSIATSIDALAVGFSLSVIGVSIWMPALVIGLVAGVLTIAGMLLGGRIGDRWGSRVEILGGLVLIAIGAKILIEHLSG